MEFVWFDVEAVEIRGRDDGALRADASGTISELVSLGKLFLATPYWTERKNAALEHGRGMCDYLIHYSPKTASTNSSDGKEQAHGKVKYVPCVC